VCRRGERKGGCWGVEGKRGHALKERKPGQQVQDERRNRRNINTPDYYYKYFVVCVGHFAFRVRFQFVFSGARGGWGGFLAGLRPRLHKTCTCDKPLPFSPITTTTTQAAYSQHRAPSPRPGRFQNESPKKFERARQPRRIEAQASHDHHTNTQPRRCRPRDLAARRQLLVGGRAVGLL